MLHAISAGCAKALCWDKARTSEKDARIGVVEGWSGETEKWLHLQEKTAVESGTIRKNLERLLLQ